MFIFFAVVTSQIIPLLQLLKYCIKVLGNATRKINNQKEEGNVLIHKWTEKNLQKNVTAAIELYYLYTSKCKLEIKIQYDWVQKQYQIHRKKSNMHKIPTLKTLKFLKEFKSS